MTEFLMVWWLLFLVMVGIFMFFIFVGGTWFFVDEKFGHPWGLFSLVVTVPLAAAVWATILRPLVF